MGGVPWGSVGGVGLGGQSGCERRIEVFVKIQKKNFFFGGVGGRGGCERRIEVFVKIQKKNFFGGVGLGGQSGCERRIEVFVKIQKQKKIFGGGGGGGGPLGGRGRVGGSEWM